MNFNEIDSLLDGFISEGVLPMVSASVWKNHNKIYEHHCGSMCDNMRILPNENTLYRIFSMTKVPVAVAMLILVQQGRCRLEDPVKDFIPEFTNMFVGSYSCAGIFYLQPAIAPVTIGHLLSMTSGIPTLHNNHTPEVEDMKLRMQQDKRFGTEWDTQKVAREIAKLPLECEPGTGFVYGMSMDVIGALIEIIAQMKLSTYLFKTLFEVLGMEDTSFYVQPAKASRLCWLAEKHFSSFTPAGAERYTPKFNSPAFEQSGDGLISTLRDYSRFALMLVDGKIDGNKELLLPRTLKLMTTAVSPELTLPHIQRVPFLAGYGYGLGVRVMIQPQQSRVQASSVGEFGWYGHAGSWFCICPQIDLVMIFMTQRLPSVHTQTIPLFYNAVLKMLGT